ncbi:MAG: hypothetical protein WBH75_01785 [Thermoanaerobaculia bacterium]
MSAQPLEAGFSQAAVDAVEERFWGQLRDLEAKYVDLWLSTDNKTPVLAEISTWRRRRDNARAAWGLIDELSVEVEQYPDAKEDRIGWRERLKEKVRRFGEERLGWPAGYRKLLVADEFFDATVEFARQARTFDPSIRDADLSQALRNVWIANSIQMLLDLEVAFSPAIFAYSMLYPYTDNYLDDPGVSAESKKSMNRRLERRLRGEDVAPLDEHQRDIFRLVDIIEEHTSREELPEVYLSLRAIHRGQVESLRQQGSEPHLGAEQILRLSVAKGGASVLADGYLAAGELSRSEAKFCFGYGVFLQFLDDLQDVCADREAGHATLFTLGAERGPLDRTTSRLYRFMHRVVESSERFSSPRYTDLKDLILRNCTFLLVGAVAENPRLFSRRFRRSLERRWPFRFASMRRLRRRASDRLGKAIETLREQREVGSPFELL